MSSADPKDIQLANLKLRNEAMRRALYLIAQSEHRHDPRWIMPKPCPACMAEHALTADGTT